MAVYSPPSEIVSLYNAQFFTSGDQGLSKSQADLLYLKLSGGTLTGNLIEAATILNANGSVGAPSYGFTNSPSSGLFRLGANNVSLAAGGINVLDVTSTNINLNKICTIAYQGAGTSQLIFNRPTSGTSAIMRNENYSIITGVIGGTINDFRLSAVSGSGSLFLSGGDNGAIQMLPGSATLQNNLRFYGSDGTNFQLAKQVTTTAGNCQNLTLSSGSVSAPNYSFLGSTNNGMYLGGTNTLGFTTNGANRLNISTTSINATIPILATQGTASNVGIGFTSFPNTGLFMQSQDLLICRNGTQILEMPSGDFCRARVGFLQSYLSDAGATYTIGNDKDVLSFTTSAMTVTLPSAATYVGRTITINNASAGSITVARAGSDVIGSLGVTSVTVLTNRTIKICAVASARWAYWLDV